MNDFSERRFLNNFSVSIAKIKVFDSKSIYWQSKMLNLAIVNDFSENERSFAIAAYPV